MNDKEVKRVYDAFKKRDFFLVTSHVNPEGDSIGSQLAVYTILKKLGKNVIMVDNDDVPANLRFLPGSKLIKRAVPENFKIETVVILDCPVKERIGSVSKLLHEGHFIINIDHHISNEPFGEINWVDGKASSVGEMIFYLIKEMGMGLDDRLAKFLYTAMVTDTGMFNYSNTSKKTHEAAGALIEMGAHPKEMHGHIFENKNFSDIKLLARALSTLKLEEGGSLAHMSLTKSMYKKEGVKHVSTDEFINFPRSIRGVKIAVFFKENYKKANVVNVSFRSSGGVDVNRLASRFGGGGHAQAAGCLLNMPLCEAQKKVLAEARKMLKGGTGPSHLFL